MLTLKKNLLFIFGTRPEAIKMAPLIKKFEQNKNFKVIICVTGQHRELLDQVLSFFKIKPDYDLNIMNKNQTLLDITTNIILGLKPIIAKEKPDLIFVHGDTVTAFSAGLAGFYSKVKIAHIEAGLRSGDLKSPFTEEINRIMLGKLSTFHFCPTVITQKNLIKENITNNVYVFGNTIIDSLFLALDLIKNTNEQDFKNYFNFLDFNKKLILITCHRRESFGEPFKYILRALRELAYKYPDCQYIYPLHANPNSKSHAKEALSNISNIFLLNSLDYPKIIWLITKSYLIITDSGGLQEEATALGKPVLIIRDLTERIEGIEIGAAKLIGTSLEKILYETSNLIDNKEEYNKMTNKINPYGDGKTSEYIMEIIEKEFL